MAEDFAFRPDELPEDRSLVLVDDDRAFVLRLARAMETLAGDSGLLPEQVWDSADIPDRGLFIGHPSGSAMPLVWAHAEYVKLCRSLRDKEIFDRPPQTVERYLVNKATSVRITWRFNNKVRSMPARRILRIETLAPAVVHWSVDKWGTVRDSATRDTTLGVHVADLETLELCVGDRVDLTFYWPDVDRWEGADFVVFVDEQAASGLPQVGSNTAL